MKKIVVLLTIPILFSMVQCKQTETSPMGSPIGDETVNKIVNQLVDNHGENMQFRIERGVKQVANLWRTTDGSTTDFEQFCKDNFCSNEAELDQLFNRLSTGYEVLFGYFMRITKDLMRPMHLDIGPLTSIDMMFAGFNASAHLTEDLFTNKIAFVTALNFPYYSLDEKTNLGSSWSRKQWAYARMGDMFTSRVPAELVQNYSRVSTNADAYIDDYNIFMGNLRNEENQQLFNDDRKLITHWGLRDELKSHYANNNGGLERQRLIYTVMQRIIDQSIPQSVINNPEYIWKPISNELFRGNDPLSANCEPVWGCKKHG